MKFHIREMTAVGLMTALICVLAPVAVPLSSMVPISLATLAVMMTSALLGARLGTLSTALYILLGMTGLPVFANYKAGAGVVFGVTGGYILGYLPLSLITALIYEKIGRRQKGAGEPFTLALGMILGTIVLYAFGTFWFIRYTGMEWNAALAACVWPFIPGDLIKIGVTCILVPKLKQSADKLVDRSNSLTSL